MKPILVIGEKLNDKFPSDKPFSRGATAKRLWRWLGYVNYKEFHKRCDAINVIPNYVNIDKVEKKTSHYDVIIALGRVAQRSLCFGFGYVVIKKIVDIDTGRIFLLLPHPSGKNISCNHKDEEIISLCKTIMNSRSSET